MKSGVVLLNKPAGVTSFQALGALKKALGHGKIGHTGTLDKFATGLLVVMVGKLTRLASKVEAQEKTYRALIRCGTETATLDPEGEVVLTLPLTPLEAWVSEMEKFTGNILQAPPGYSAVHIQGKRAYERILAGEKVEMQARPVTIHSLEIIRVMDPEGRPAPAPAAPDFRPGFLEVLVRCGKGTYIRSLARDWAKAAGTCGSLAGLERLSVGSLTLEGAVDPGEFRTEPDLRDPAPFLPDWGLQKVSILDEYLPQLLQGKDIRESWFLPSLKDLSDHPALVYDQKGQISAMIEPSGTRWKYCFAGGG